MRWLIWGVTLVVLGVWTLLAAVAAGLAAWLAEHGPALVVAASESDARLQLAAWLEAWLGSGWTQWIPPVWLDPLRQGVEALTGLLQMAWPWLGGLLGWVAPLVWVIWGLGALFVVVLAGGLHLWLARRARPAVRM
jgi:hypothetical protein